MGPLYGLTQHRADQLRTVLDAGGNTAGRASFVERARGLTWVKVTGSASLGWHPGVAALNEGGTFVDLTAEVAVQQATAAGSVLSTGSYYPCLRTSDEPSTGRARFVTVTRYLVVKELDGSPSAISVEEISFDQADGFLVTDFGNRTIRIDMLPASTTQAGIVLTTSQNWAGGKSSDTSFSVANAGIYARNTVNFTVPNNAATAPAAATATVPNGSAAEMVRLTSPTEFAGYIVGTDGADTSHGEDVWIVPAPETPDATNYYTGRLIVAGRYATWLASDGKVYTGETATTGGLTFVNGIYTSGTATTYTDEQAQDAVGTILTDTDTIDFTYNDATPSITAAARVQMSITSDASGLKLSGDSASPGNDKLYGTGPTGTKGWFTQPTGLPAPGTAGRIVYDNGTAWVALAPPAGADGTYRLTIVRSGGTNGSIGWQT